ncbi:MAG: aminotransferase class IV [Tissierellia bacterium]|nr:aminotransferase class IV [Tissierellia bacterium]
MFIKNGTQEKGRMVHPQEGIYEVLRRENGVYLFREDHLSRLKRNLKIGGKEAFFQKMVQSLDMVPQGDDPISVMVVLDLSSNDVYVTSIEVDEKTDEERQEGVAVGVMEYVREAPNRKIYRKTFKERVQKLLKEEGLFEMLLLSEGTIREGSRSNFFYVLEDCLYTPPSEGVLPGITKKQLIDILEKNDIPWKERELRVRELHRVEGGFLTGTGMDVTNIHTLGGRILPNPTLPRRIVQLFRDHKIQYIQKNPKDL